MEHHPDAVSKELSRCLGPLGLECHPFKVGWYNDTVASAFHLPYDYDTLAYIVVSTPDMFDNAFKPFVHKKSWNCSSKDPVDECMAHHFARLKLVFPDQEVEVLHDYELTPNRRPKVLVQTAGHVAGAAYFYQRSDLNPDPWDREERIYGVSVHPDYGGWFGLRAALILARLRCPDLARKQPLDVVPSNDRRIELLERFNFHWEDWSFRDVVPVKKRYSKEQMNYFAAKPSERFEIITRMRLEECANIVLSVKD